MPNRMLGIALRTCTPRRWTSSGRRVSTSCTRFLRQHLRDVEVGADRERDGYGEIAIPGRLAVHVEHILDAVDLLFERRGDGTGDGLSGCAGIGCRDLHRRRDDFWILGDRKNRERAQTKRRHKDAEHGCEARAIDEEMCQAHVVDSALALAFGRGAMDRAVLWGDFCSWCRVRNALDDDLIVWREAGPDHAQAAAKIADLDPLATVMTMCCDWSGSTAVSGTRRAGTGAPTTSLTRANTPGVSKRSGFGTVARAWIVPLDRLSALSTKSRVPCRANSVSSLSATSILSARPPLSRARSRKKVRKSDSLISKSR